MMGNFCGAGLVFLVCQKKKKKLRKKKKNCLVYCSINPQLAAFSGTSSGPLSSRQQTVKHTQHKHKLSYFCMRISSKDLV